MGVSETISGRVSIEVAGGVAEVRLDRADKLNALDTLMFDALIEAGARLRGNQRSARRRALRRGARLLRGTRHGELRCDRLWATRGLSRRSPRPLAWPRQSRRRRRSYGAACRFR